jgi:TRAP-type C4-dicarboxylate transport system substrate-binding protein
LRKKLIFGLVIMTIFVLSMVGACSQASTSTPAASTSSAPPATSTSAQPETIKLGFASIWPTTHYTMAEQFPRYFKMVQDAANGKYILDVEYYPVGTLLAEKDIYDGVASGVVDAGQSSFGYTPGRFPVTLTLNQPGIAPPENSDAAAQTVWDFYNKYKPAELNDTHVLYLFATGPGYMHSNKPILAVDDMKGLKIRVTGGGVRGVQAVGGDPIAIPMGEVYEAAQKGLIDALVSPPETLEGWKHAELFKYSTSVPYFYSEFFWVTMNLDKWNSMPKGLQDAFNSVAQAAVTDAGAIWQYQQKHGMDFASAQPGGHEFLRLPDSEVAKLKEVLKPIRDDYIKVLNDQGFNGEEIVNTASTIVENNNKKTYPPYQP